MMYEPTAVIWRKDTVTITILFVFLSVCCGFAAVKLLPSPGGLQRRAAGQFRRQAKFDGLLTPGQLADLDRAESAQRVDDILHQNLRRRSARGDADDLRVAEPIRLNLAAVGDQVARRAGFLAYLAQAVGIGTVLGANHQDNVDKRTKFTHRRLPVLGRVANVARLRSDNIGEALVQRGDDAARVVDTERRLRDIGDRRIGGDIE
jgi:hypothetical protein